MSDDGLKMDAIRESWARGSFDSLRERPIRDATLLEIG